MKCNTTQIAIKLEPTWPHKRYIFVVQKIPPSVPCGINQQHCKSPKFSAVLEKSMDASQYFKAAPSL